MTMKELSIKFQTLLCYVPYIIDEKQKIQCFLICLPIMFKERIEYNNPTTLEEAMRKANFCYNKNKKKQKVHQIGKLKYEITLIQERRLINLSKIWGIVTKGIKEVTIKVLTT